VTRLWSSKLPRRALAIGAFSETSVPVNRTTRSHIQEDCCNNMIDIYVFQTSLVPICVFIFRDLLHTDHIQGVQG
jgi:hypothetical protein